MNNYDYRSYFQEIINGIDSISTNQNNELTEIQEIRTELNQNFENLNNNIKGYSIFIAAILLIATIFGVLK